MYVCLTMQMFIWQKTARWKISNDRHMKKINPIIKGNFAVSVKYKISSKTQWKNSTNHKEQTIQDEFKQIPFVDLHQQAQRVGKFWTDVWNQSKIETWYGQVFLTIPRVQWNWGSTALGKSLPWARRNFLNLQLWWGTCELSK